MKTFLIFAMCLIFGAYANAQLVTKTATSSKTLPVSIAYSTDKANQPFSVHTVLQAAKMHTNDSITLSISVSNDNTNWVAYPGFTPLVFKKTTYSQITSSTLMYKYLKLTYTPSSNDSTFTITSYLFKQ